MYVQKSGLAYEHDPHEPHGSAANQLGLFVGPVVAKVATQYIEQLSELDRHGSLQPVKCARRTADGRNVIDRGIFPDDSNLLLAGAPSALCAVLCSAMPKGSSLYQRASGLLHDQHRLWRRVPGSWRRLWEGRRCFGE